MIRLRLGLAICGFILALLSVALNDRRIAWGAIALLIASLLVRLVMRKTDQRKHEG